MPITYVIWEGDHKNSVRCVATKLEKFRYKVEMWQRPRFGVPYVSVHANSVHDAFNACDSALKIKPRRY